MIAGIVQARMGSTRLPGKVLMQIQGKSLIALELERISRAKMLDNIIVATTVSPSDDELVAHCEEMGYAVYRGSEEDVLERYYKAATAFHVDTVVRLTGDCPIIDPVIVDDAVAFFKTNIYDYISNANPPTLPDGMDTEVFTFLALEKAHKEAHINSEREHVTPYMWKNKDIFSVGSRTYLEDWSHIRLTVDEPEDFELMKKVFDSLYPTNPSFALEDIINVLHNNSDWLTVNKQFERNEGYKKSLQEDKKV